MDRRGYPGSSKVLTTTSGTRTKRHIWLPTTAANVMAHLLPPMQSNPAAVIPATKSAMPTPQSHGPSVVERESNNASESTTPNISTNNVRKDVVLRAVSVSTRLLETFTSLPESPSRTATYTSTISRTISRTSMRIPSPIGFTSFALALSSAMWLSKTCRGNTRALPQADGRTTTSILSTTPSNTPTRRHTTTCTSSRSCQRPTCHSDGTRRLVVLGNKMNSLALPLMLHTRAVLRRISIL